jgi:hypothetical protein
MKKILILSIISVGLFLYSCEIDNYLAPDRILEGNVVDKVTGENLQTRQPNGIKIRLLEEAYKNPQPYDFWAKSDGSFRNTKLFRGKYTVVAMEGAFEGSDTVKIDLDQPQSIKFKVEPYLRLKNVSITSPAAGTIKATYNIEFTTSTKDPNKCFLMAYTDKILHEATVGLKKSAERNLAPISHPVIASTNYVDQITGLKAGTYYARVGVLTTNSLNSYNYSAIIELVVE